MEPNTPTTENHISDAPTTSPTASAPGTAAEDNSLLMGILCYISILVIIPYLMAKDTALVHFHLKQGIVLVVIEMIIFVVGNMMLLGMFWPILSLVNFGCIVLSIIGIVNVVQKKEAALPLVGGLSAHVKI